MTACACSDTARLMSSADSPVRAEKRSEVHIRRMGIWPLMGILMEIDLAIMSGIPGAISYSVAERGWDTGQ